MKNIECREKKTTVQKKQKIQKMAVENANKLLCWCFVDN